MVTIDPQHPPETATHIIFTDGSGKRGWAAIIFEPGIGAYELSGKETEQVTNNRMEMLAAIKALESRLEKDGHESFEIYIFTDSSYLADNLRMVPIWRDRDWMTTGYKEKGIEPAPVANRDFWERLDKLSHELHFRLIQIARSSHPFNKRADQLAGEVAVD